MKDQLATARTHGSFYHFVKSIKALSKKRDKASIYSELLSYFNTIYQAQLKKNNVVARKLDAVGWIKYLSISVLWWLTFGFILAVGSQSLSVQVILLLMRQITGVIQLLTSVYRRQWIFELL